MMATEYPVNLPTQANFTQYGFGKPTTYYAQTHSGHSTPGNVSPTSPRNGGHLAHLQIHTPQLRPPKSPLYVPAALRPTEKPIRHSPPKSTASTIESPDSNWSGRASRRPTGESFDSGLSRTVTEEWQEDILGPVTGPPSKNHWKPDNAVSSCSMPGCDTQFSWFSRRHHCRRCGDIFCAAHSAHAVRLNQVARFHPDANYYRACDRCWGSYRDWEVQRASRSNSQSSQGSSAVGIASPVARRSGDAASAVPNRLAVPDQQVVGSVAGSVPRDWNWSTF